MSKTTSSLCVIPSSFNTAQSSESAEAEHVRNFCSYPYQPYPFDNIHILSVSATTRINITFTATYRFDELLPSPYNFDQHRKRGQRPAMCLRGWGKGGEKISLRFLDLSILVVELFYESKKWLQILKILYRWSIFGAAKTLHILPIP